MLSAGVQKQKQKLKKHRLRAQCGRWSATPQLCKLRCSSVKTNLRAHLRLKLTRPPQLEEVAGRLSPLKDLAGGQPYAALRALYDGPWMVNNGYSRAMALEAVATGAADLVAFGKPFISNPDLVRRLREDAPLQPLVQATLYGGGAAGYTDYPALEVAAAGAST